MKEKLEKLLMALEAEFETNFDNYAKMLKNGNATDFSTEVVRKKLTANVDSLFKCKSALSLYTVKDEAPKAAPRAKPKSK